MGTLNNLTFRRESENDLILISVWVDKDPLTFAIDTGATHSVIDLSQLIIMGYDLNMAIGNEQISTASGIESAYIFNINSIEFMGIKHGNFKVRALDLVSTGAGFYFDGLLGLDFFANNKICIDMKEQIISISKS